MKRVSCSKPSPIYGGRWHAACGVTNAGKAPPWEELSHASVTVVGRVLFRHSERSRGMTLLYKKMFRQAQHDAIRSNAPTCHGFAVPPAPVNRGRSPHPLDPPPMEGAGGKPYLVLLFGQHRDLNGGDRSGGRSRGKAADGNQITQIRCICKCIGTIKTDLHIHVSFRQIIFFDHD